MSNRSHVTTHVLDAAQGIPAAGIPVQLDQRSDNGTWQSLATATTNADGRVSDLGPEQLEAGVYRITFDTASYFARTGQRGFYPEITISFELADASAHYHVPVLLSPFSYSTYRGS